MFSRENWALWVVVLGVFSVIAFWGSVAFVSWHLIELIKG